MSGGFWYLLEHSISMIVTKTEIIKKKTLCFGSGIYKKYSWWSCETLYYHGHSCLKEISWVLGGFCQNLLIFFGLRTNLVVFMTGLYGCPEPNQQIKLFLSNLFNGLALTNHFLSLSPVFFPCFYFLFFVLYF